jgi:uncharacterized protein YgbK (DUF1537 family)
VLDDDPTGTQTVHDLWVYTRWTPETLREALSGEGPAFYLLTNSRSLPEPEAVVLHRELAAALSQAAREVGCELEVISRSDSTLRGHYPAEVLALQQGLEQGLGCRYDGVLICPCFPEGGRLTADDIHWVVQGDLAIPAGQTEFARDATFGYRASDLREWVAEKTRGAVPADQVRSISLDLIRREGPEGVLGLLGGLRDGAVAIVNATTYGDLEVVALALLQAEAAGRRFLLRTAASFVRARAGLGAHPLLAADEMIAGRTGGGLTVVGSYVDRTTQQLRQALTLDRVVAVELSVECVLEAAEWPSALEGAVQTISAALTAGRDVVLYTSRERVTRHGLAGDLGIGARISAALVEVVRGVNVAPRYLIAKGGITSSDIATRGLDVERAWVMGQIMPGVPVWRLGPESRWPGMAYVVFPGNVGDELALRRAIEQLGGRL